MTTSTTPGTRRTLLVGFPATLAIDGAIVALMALTAFVPRWYPPLLRDLGDSWSRLAAGQAWRPFTSAFVQSRHGFVIGIVILLWLVPLAEWRAGSRVAAAAFFLGDWISSLSVMIGLRIASGFGIDAATHALGHLDSGASAGFYACGGAFVTALPAGRLRTLGAVALAGDLVIEGVVTHMLAEVEHPVAVLVGVVAAIVGGRHR